MRSRNIKPGFFKNEELAECQPLARLLFSGLWCMADKSGRLEYRPKRIKAELLPYDNCKIETLLKQLQERNFILIYSVSTEKYIQILKFSQHQNPNIKECESTIPAPESTVQAQCQHISNTADSLIPHTDSLIPHTEYIPPDKPDGSRVHKKKFFDCVLLTEDEHAKLEAEFNGQTETKIKALNDYIMSTGKKYKSHYHTILNWERMPQKTFTGGRRNDILC